MKRKITKSSTSFFKSKRWLYVFFPVSTAILGGVGITLIKEAVTDFISEDLVAASPILLHIFAVFFLMAIFVLLKTIWGEVNEKFGIRIKYIDLDKNNEVALFDDFLELVESAENSIIVVNSYLAEHHPQASNSMSEKRQKEIRRATDKRKQYYDKLVEKARDGLSYTRLIQSKTESINYLFENDLEKLEHLYETISARDANHDVTLMQVKPTRLVTFVLVDEKKLILQVNDYSFDETTSTEKTRIHGAFIIVDEQQKLIRHFVNFADSLSRKRAKTLEENMLPDLPRKKTVTQQLTEPDTPSAQNVVQKNDENKVAVPVNKPKT